MAEIKITGKKVLRTINREFQEQFPYLGLAFFTPAEWAKVQEGKTAARLDGGSKLADVRTVPPPKDEKELSIHGRTLVKNLEEKFLEIYGLKAQVIYQKGTQKYYTGTDGQGMNAMGLTQLNKKLEEEGYEKHPGKDI